MTHHSPGTLLLDRFVLNEQLRPGLWRAQDRELSADTLIEVYDSTEDELEALRQLVRKFREVSHPHLARVFDLHHDDAVIVVPLAASGTTLLSTQLEQTGPLPYREVLDKVRPVIEGLRTLHDHGVIHSGIHTDNIVTDETGAWQLLPGKPAADTLSTEMQHLGELISSVLLGGEVLEPGKEPNNVPDKLFGGRTLPALLNQLVTDMRSSSADRRPAGMGDALNRLDAIDKLAETEIPDEPIPVVADAPVFVPSAVTTHKKRNINAAMVFIAFLFVMFVCGAIGIWWYIQGEDKKAAAEEVRRLKAAAQPASVATNGTTRTEGEVDLVKRALEKAEAEEALDKYMAAKRGAEDVGAHRWATKDFSTAIRAAAIADQAFIDKAFVKSAEMYSQSATKLGTITEGKDAALERLLEDGAFQLLEGTTATATKAYETALLIDPANAEAQEGLRRAKNLDKRNALLASAADHEANKRFAFAYTDFEEAAKLDPDSERAVAGLARLKDKISEDRFQAMMSKGLTAFHAGDFELATKTLNDAKIFQPDRSEVDEALEMVAEGIRLRKIKNHQQAAQKMEQQENWQDARKEYLAVLEIDTNIQFANEGRSRSESRITLMKKLDHYNANTGLLLKPAGLQDAQLVLSQAQEILGKGPQLQKAYDLLNRSVKRASQKVQVTLRSDGKTSVDMYKVGKFGTFTAKNLELLPGTYTVVGHRNGYRDVRAQLVLTPGQTEASLSVVCTERF